MAIIQNSAVPTRLGVVAVLLAPLVWVSLPGTWSAPFLQLQTYRRCEANNISLGHHHLLLSAVFPSSSQLSRALVGKSVELLLSLSCLERGCSR